MGGLNETAWEGPGSEGGFCIAGGHNVYPCTIITGYPKDGGRGVTAE